MHAGSSSEATGGPNSISERLIGAGGSALLNETFSVDKKNSFLVTKYGSAHSSGAPAGKSTKRLFLSIFQTVTTTQFAQRPFFVLLLTYFFLKFLGRTFFAF